MDECGSLFDKKRKFHFNCYLIPYTRGASENTVSTVPGFKFTVCCSMGTLRLISAVLELMGQRVNSICWIHIAQYAFCCCGKEILLTLKSILAITISVVLCKILRILSHTLVLTYRNVSNRGRGHYFFKKLV